MKAITIYEADDGSRYETQEEAEMQDKLLSGELCTPELCKALVELIRHAWVHTAYRDCGYKQMTTEQKMLYRKITRRTEE